MHAVHLSFVGSQICSIANLIACQILKIAIETLKVQSEKIENDLGDSLMTKLIWKPQNFVEASNELEQTVSKLMEALENDEDVQSVHSNLVFS